MYLVEPSFIIAPNPKIVTMISEQPELQVREHSVTQWIKVRNVWAWCIKDVYMRYKNPSLSH
jgi:hypothetical protein